MQSAEYQQEPDDYDQAAAAQQDVSGPLGDGLGCSAHLLDALKAVGVGAGSFGSAGCNDHKDDPRSSCELDLRSFCTH